VVLVAHPPLERLGRDVVVEAGRDGGVGLRRADHDPRLGLAVPGPERLAPAPIAALERGFAIVVVTEGAGALLAEGGEPLPVRRGDTVLVPWAAGHCHLEGDVEAIACRPPDEERAR